MKKIMLLLVLLSFAAAPGYADDWGPYGPGAGAMVSTVSGIVETIYLHSENSTAPVTSSAVMLKSIQYLPNGDVALTSATNTNRYFSFNKTDKALLAILLAAKQSGERISLRLMNVSPVPQYNAIAYVLYPSSF